MSVQIVNVFDLIREHAEQDPEPLIVNDMSSYFNAGSGDGVMTLFMVMSDPLYWQMYWQLTTSTVNVSLRSWAEDGDIIWIANFWEWDKDETETG